MRFYLLGSMWFLSKRQLKDNVRTLLDILREDERVTGLKLKKESYKLRAVADGLVLIQTDSSRGTEL